MLQHLFDSYSDNINLFLLHICNIMCVKKLIFFKRVF